MCPADLYELNDEGDMMVNWEGCLECGTCLICCDERALTWTLPARRVRRAVPDELRREGASTGASRRDERTKER